MTQATPKTNAANFARFLLSAYDYIAAPQTNREYLAGVRIEIEESGKCVIVATDARALYKAECQIATANIPPGGISAIVNLKPALPELRKAAKQQFSYVRLLTMPGCMTEDSENFATSLFLEIGNVNVILTSLFASYIKYVKWQNIIDNNKPADDCFTINCNMSEIGNISKQLKNSEDSKDYPLLKIADNYYNISNFKVCQHFNDATIYITPDEPAFVKHQQCDTSDELLVAMPLLVGKKAQGNQMPYFEFKTFTK